MSKKPNPELDAELITKYQKGQNVKTIGSSRGLVYKALKRANLTADRQKKKTAWYYTAATLYIYDVKITDIAKQLKKSRSNVYYALKKSGVLK